MNWFIGILMGCCFVLFVCMILFTVANQRTAKKRHQLIGRWNTSGDHKRAILEYNEVDYVTHCKACCWLQNPKKLYGPLIQGVWDNDQPITYDPYWWRCYNEIYLKLEPHHQARVKYVMTKGYGKTLSGRRLGQDNLIDALVLCSCDIEAWLAQKPPPADRFTMTAGAEEYEQIMAMQDLING